MALGPASRRGALDKDGAQAVGGVVVARFGSNPLAVIKNVKVKIAEIAPSLPTKVVIDPAKVNEEEVRRLAEENHFAAYADSGELNHEGWLHFLRTRPRASWPAWITTSHVTVVPAYDRTGLIYETLGTLNDAIGQEILITAIVVILMITNLRSSVLIGGMMPLAVLLCFIAMKTFHVDANIVALSGIAIAIGTIVDMGIVLCENILHRLEEAPPDAPRLEVVHHAASEVGSAVLTAVSTTVVGFLPVFAMTGPEGKLFKPLAFTKTFALIASIVIALTVIPPLAHVLFCGRISSKKVRGYVYGLLTAGLAALAVFGLARFGADRPCRLGRGGVRGLRMGTSPAVATVAAGRSLAGQRGGRAAGGFAAHQELGPPGAAARGDKELPVRGDVGGRADGPVPPVPALLPADPGLVPGPQGALPADPLGRHGAGSVHLAGVPDDHGLAAGGVEKLGIDPQVIRSTTLWVGGSRALPGLGREFMPPLDEGSFLWMPTTMAHASIGEALDIVSRQDQAFGGIPEVESVLGKLGRMESALDPAPISMFETIVNYRTEYVTDKAGRRVNFRYDSGGIELAKDADGLLMVAADGENYYVRGQFARDKAGRLISDAAGRPFRQWRPTLETDLNEGRTAWAGIRSPDDIWAELVKAGQIPGTTSAPKLQPIAARIVMLQSGMRAAMGVKIYGPTLAAIERFGLEIEKLLKEVPVVDSPTVIADRIVAKPYLEIVPDRLAMDRYGVKMREFQDVVEIAIGGMPVTTTVEGRQRFPVRIRYPRELRDTAEALGRVLVPGMESQQIPLEQIAEIRYAPGPQEIKNENTFLTGYVLFDMKPGQAEVDVVEQCRRYLDAKIKSGELIIPEGVSYTFAGSYENQIRSRKTLALILPLAMFVIFLILYFQFDSIPTTLLVFSGIFVAWAGGFLLIWLYGRGWFLDFSVFGVNMRELFRIHPINLSVAVWVGFLALFGIASDDGVIMATYLNQSFAARKPDTLVEIRQAVLAGGTRRIRPCLMTTATTILALLPVLTSTGRGSDIMIPMAIPSFGGMTIQIMTMLIVPVLYCALKEWRLQANRRASPAQTE